MATVWIDYRPYEVDPSRNLLDVALALGFDLPYFCWHPAFGSVGACRQCAVKQFRDENDKRGKLVMACMTPAAPGTRIAIADSEAKTFRRSVAEWLMVNHPHDCPVCDEGGECHLQDMTHMTGQVYRHYRFKKRTFRNQNLGPLVHHEMNRCIECYRCVRYYRDFAGGSDLNVFAAHDHVYFGRAQEGTLESPFAGNLVEVCPTGVFTDKTLGRHYTRKWDLSTAPSVCVHCSLGCNTIPGERYGELRRIRDRYHGAINGYFLCDRGRYAYEFVNSERRLRTPLAPRGPDAAAQALSREEAFERFGRLIASGRLVGIGSPRASLEANYALRALVGPENFFAGMGAIEGDLTTLVARILRSARTSVASLRDVANADAVLVLGEDATNTAPVLGLALRQASRRAPREAAVEMKIPLWQDAAVRDLVGSATGPFYIATPATTDLDSLTRTAWHGTPEDIARLGFAVAHALDPETPTPRGIDRDIATLAERIAADLAAARRPVVVSGTSCESAEVVAAAANVAWAAGKARHGEPASLCYALPECNSLGLALLGGGTLARATQILESGEATTAVVLENDLWRRDPGAAARLFASARHVVVLDHLANDTAARAELVLPAGTFAETDGTLVNNEGRAQRFFQVMVPDGDVLESWRWIAAAAVAAGRRDLDWHSLDEVLTAMARDLPELAPARRAAPGADFRLAGARLARAPHRYSGRTAMLAHRTVHEPKPPADPDAPFTFSMEGYAGAIPGALLHHIWSPGWNSVQALTRFREEIAGPLRGGDSGVHVLTPGGEEPPPYFDDTSPTRTPTTDELRLVPLYHVFGSEELSAHSSPIAALTPTPYLALSPGDAASLGIAAGEHASLWISEKAQRLPVRIDPGLRRGVAGLPVGLAGVWRGNLPRHAKVSRA